MKLHYFLKGTGKSVVLLHGLFGDAHNLTKIASALSLSHQTISFDLRNHGHSFWDDEMNYVAMANDIKESLEDLNLNNITVIGHSMGGKVAMMLPQIMPNTLSQLFIIDIAPVTYPPLESHLAIFKLLNQIKNNPNHLSRQKAFEFIIQSGLEASIGQFLLKSYLPDSGNWRFNVSALEKNYANIMEWAPLAPTNIPVTLIMGGASSYVTEKFRDAILTQFPNTKAHIIANAGHWVHVEKPEQVIKIISLKIDKSVY